MLRARFQYIVDFSIPMVVSEKFSLLIPDQRAMVNDYFFDGKLFSYALSLEAGKLWAVFIASDETEVMEWVNALPLTRFMHYKISTLTFYNTVTAHIPNFSLN